LNYDGSLDTTFDPGPSQNIAVRSFGIQPDGRIVIGGYTVCGCSGNIGRLNPDGSSDPSFNPRAGTDGVINSLSLYRDGTIAIAGEFTMVDGIVRNRYAILNSDGSLNPEFDAKLGANAEVSSVLFQDSGRVLVAGRFTSIGLNSRRFVARLNGLGSPRLLQSPTNQVIAVGGSATFHVNVLGNGLRYQWRFRSSSLQYSVLPGQTNPTLRISNVQKTNQGYYEVTVENAAGAVKAEAWLYANLPGSPVIVQQPSSQSARVGDSVIFSVSASGTNLGYNWSKDGGIPRTVATNSILTLTNVQQSDAGIYVVQVSNPYGIAFSAPATLTFTGAATPASVSSPSYSKSLGFASAVSGESGYFYRVDGSTNLMQWTHVTNILMSTSPTMFIDRDAAGFDRRFYRVVAP